MTTRKPIKQIRYITN